MKKIIVMLPIAALILTPLAVSGCQTYGEGAGLGAGLGAVAGAVIGNQSGHALEGAAIGAVVGGVAGLIAHDIKVHKQRSREETAQTYNYQPSQGEVLSFERAEVLPQNVRPGEEIEGTIQYALLGTGAGVQVTETRALLQGDRVLYELSTKSFTRDEGTWVSSQQFRLPSDLVPGPYTLLTRVGTAQSSISGRSNFRVN